MGRCLACSHPTLLFWGAFHMGRILISFHCACLPQGGKRAGRDRGCSCWKWRKLFEVPDGEGRTFFKSRRRPLFRIGRLFLYMGSKNKVCRVDGGPLEKKAAHPAGEQLRPCGGKMAGFAPPDQARFLEMREKPLFIKNFP